MTATLPFTADQLEQQWVIKPKDPVAWAATRFPKRHLWSKQRDILASVRDNNRTAVKACHGVGKALPLDTLIPTPDGWTTMGDLQVGDEVFDQDGRPCAIIATSEVWTDRPCYRIEFSDGSSLIADAEHEWSVLDLSRRRRSISDWRVHWDDSVVMTTCQMIDAGLRTKKGQMRWRVPTAKPLELDEQELDVDPYVLGAWLGDGSKDSATISCHPDDVETIERISALGENARRYDFYTWQLTGNLPDRDRLATRLRHLGVLKNKHIPAQYLRASYAQRLELLRGLMDTDGFVFVPGRGMVGIDFCDKQLFDDVAELVRSFGWMTRTSSGPAAISENGGRRVVGTRWRLNFRPDTEVFHLQRKLDAWGGYEASQASRHTVRTIVSIEPVASVPTRCIEVDSPRHLYLAGKDMIPTHNSWISGLAAAWWVDAYPADEILVVTTAPTSAQVGAILWHEIRGAHREANLPGKIGLDNVWRIGDVMVGLGRKPADHDEHGFQGLHRRRVLVIADEACGIPQQLWTAFEAITTNADCRILAIGNPDDPSSEFASVCKPGSGWNVITISAYDSPNLSGEEVPDSLTKMLVSEDWVEDKKHRWGEASPRFQSKCLGQFPELGSDTLIAPGWITAAQEREMAPDGKDRISVDVARFGHDSSIVGLARGGVFRVLDTIPFGTTTELAGITTRRIKENGNCDVIIDGGGVGGGVVDTMRENVTEGVFGRVKRPVIREFVAGGKPRDQKEFANARSEAWWNLRLMFQNGEVDIDPNDDQLAAQLGAIKYRFDSKGRIQVETKDEMAKRKVASPDRGDTMMQAYALTGQDTPKLPAASMSRQIGRAGARRR